MQAMHCDSPKRGDGLPVNEDLAQSSEVTVPQGIGERWQNVFSNGFSLLKHPSACFLSRALGAEGGEPFLKCLFRVMQHVDR
jgi:hypothetical protein